MSPLAYRFSRLSAHFYDALLVVAMMMTLTLLLLPLNHGMALTSQQIGVWSDFYQVFLIMAISCYFVISWVRRGQTLGLKTWGLTLITSAGDRPTASLALRRLTVLLSLNLLLIMGLGALLLAKLSVWAAVTLMTPWFINVLAILIAGQSLEDRFSGLRLVPAQRVLYNDTDATTDNSSRGSHATNNGGQ